MTNTVSTISPLTLTDRQKDVLANGAIRLYLNPRQIAHLQDFGLVAEHDEWYHHPSGSFALPPRNVNRPARKRMTLASVTSA